MEGFYPWPVHCIERAGKSNILHIFDILYKTWSKDGLNHFRHGMFLRKGDHFCCQVQWQCFCKKMIILPAKNKWLNHLDVLSRTRPSIQSVGKFKGIIQTSVPDCHTCWKQMGILSLTPNHLCFPCCFSFLIQGNSQQTMFIQIQILICKRLKFNFLTPRCYPSPVFL